MLTTTEAADRLGIKPQSVARYIERGLITATKHGRDYAIDEAEIERFQRERRNVGKPRRPKE